MDQPDRAAAGASPIPFLTLPNWLKAAAQCGFNIEPVFRRLGIPTDLIHLESATVQPAQLQAAMEACVAQARNHHFPFVLGETFAFDYMPDIGTFLATSSTLRETLRVFDWVRALINPALTVALQERGAEAWLVLEFAGAPEPTPYFAETTFASIVKFARMLLGDRARFGRLCLQYPAPAYAGEYRRHFATEVRFGQPLHALVLPRALLDLPLEGAFPALHRQAEFRVRQQLQQLPGTQGFIARIERCFAAHPELLGQGIGSTAAALGVHPRTLQRRLRAEGRSFADLQSAARFSLAAQWLQERQLDIESISERLGFSDRRSFTRAFTRWAGSAPSAFRARARPSHGG
ncbi:MAG: AraC family transcriptional regulator ligand-binding domain-containing protein [Nevskia sp.]|nr:AraC family transcriptional regulator ligand-binding domain-containing protein [Nevskia sp.]